MLTFNHMTTILILSALLKASKIVRKNLATLLIAAIALPATGLAQSTDAPHWEKDPQMPRHAIYVEAFGASGDRASLNYEYTVFKGPRASFSARTGVFYMHQKSVEPFKVARDAGDMIFGINTTYRAASRHRIETGFGVNIRWQRLEGVTDYLSSNLLNASMGYRLLPEDGKGFMFRATLMLIQNAEYNWLEYYVEGEQRPTTILPWAGVSLGYAF